MDDQTISGVPDQVAALNLDEAATDVCTRCSEIPWINGPKHSQIYITSFSPNCRICHLLRTWMLCGHDDTLILEWRPTPEELKEQLEDHKFQSKTIEVTQEWPPEEHVNADGSTILVSDLSLKQAKTALQLLSISPVMLLSRIGHHLRDCIANHGNTCALQEDRNPLHLRVIDCDTRTVVDAPADCDFVALSYVWGGASAIQGFDITEDLPLTVEHSMYVTAELGFKYLWIDRYCINQQDQQHRDDQINQMSTIYSAAQLTIVAAAGSDPTHGLPGIALHSRPGVFAKHEKMDQICLSALRSDIHTPGANLNIVAQSIWASRAWTYQEAVFSRRRLVFTESQAIFSCNRNTYLESGVVSPNHACGYPGTLVPWFNLLQGLSDFGNEPILNILEQYCRRELSYDSDALRAISGTLNLLLKHEHFHLWGVPGQIHSICTDQGEHQQTHQQTISKESSRTFDGFEYLLHLDWRRDSVSRQRLTEPCRRLGFPSWSPLGWSSGEISWSYKFAYTGRISFHTSLGRKEISEFIQYVRTDHTKIPQQISLSLKTTTIEVCEDGDIALWLGSRLLQVIIATSWDKSEPAEGTCLKAALIAEDSDLIFFLLLEATGNDIYERCGSFHLYKKTLAELGAPGHMSGLKIWHDDLEEEASSSEEEESSHKRYHGRIRTFAMELQDLDTRDQERLRTSFGDLETYEWWKNLSFTEGHIIIG